MKVTIHRCDFCGGKVPVKQPMAQLIVPLTKEDEQLKARIEGGRQPAEDIIENYMFRMFHHPRSGPPSKTFDMCLECAKGILMSRFREVRRMLTTVDE